LGEVSRQHQIPYGKTKMLKAITNSSQQNQNLTAKANSSRQNEKLTVDPKPRGKTKIASVGPGYQWCALLRLNPRELHPAL